MKYKWTLYVIFLVSILVLAGCSKSNSKIETKNQVEEVIKNQMAGTVSSQSATPKDQVAEKETEKEIEKETEKDMDIDNSLLDNHVDYDLTQMSSDMVYATVYQMMIAPGMYEGKVVHMMGTLNSSWYEPTQKYYHYVVIADAAACCQQGLEFVWEDGTHSYPEEYPTKNAIVEVTGTFETYKEEKDSNLYCRLKDASMTEVK